MYSHTLPHNMVAKVPGEKRTFGITSIIDLCYTQFICVAKPNGSQNEEKILDQTQEPFPSWKTGQFQDSTRAQREAKCHKTVQVLWILS